MITSVPDEYGALLVQLTVGDAAAAIDFYRRAFDADELYRQSDAGGTRIVHCELLIGLSRFIVHDEVVSAGLLSPQRLGGSPITLMLYVEDVDQGHARALDCGAQSLAPPEDKFWGLRSAVILDPFGHRWLLAARIEDLSPPEIIERAEKASAEERVPMGRGFFG